MIRLAFTEVESEQLTYERFYHPHPRVQKKMEAEVRQFSGQSDCLVQV